MNNYGEKVSFIWDMALKYYRLQRIREDAVADESLRQVVARHLLRELCGQIRRT